MLLTVEEMLPAVIAVAAVPKNCRREVFVFEVFVFMGELG